ncbi:MAG: glycosyltransferase [Acidobacteriota bacterium]|nr:glycosyltransferase [Acidobacteriota bacterium]
MPAATPDVSVLMPCFNGARWIAGAIESVLAQTFVNYELVLVDDGSTDGTVDIVRRYAAASASVVVVEKAHTDVSDTLNIGLRTARGRWVARLDQDDVSLPARLAEQMAYLSAHPEVVFLGSGFIRLDEHGREISAHTFPTTHRGLMSNLERMKGFCPHSTAVFLRDLALEAGGYRFALNDANDYDLWLRLSAYGRLASLPAALVKCRTHSAQMSQEGGGLPQILAGVAGGTAHFLRKGGHGDPFANAEASRERAFLDFVERGIEQSGLIGRRRVWVDLRAGYFSRRNRVLGAGAFLNGLVRSGYAAPLLWEKSFGLTLPRDLAEGWVRKTCAAS